MAILMYDKTETFTNSQSNYSITHFAPSGYRVVNGGFLTDRPDKFEIRGSNPVSGSGSVSGPTPGANTTGPYPGAEAWQCSFNVVATTADPVTVVVRITVEAV